MHMHKQKHVVSQQSSSLYAKLWSQAMHLAYGHLIIPHHVHFFYQCVFLAVELSWTRHSIFKKASLAGVLAWGLKWFPVPSVGTKIWLLVFTLFLVYIWAFFSSFPGLSVLRYANTWIAAYLIPHKYHWYVPTCRMGATDQCGKQTFSLQSIIYSPVRFFLNAASFGGKLEHLVLYNEHWPQNKWSHKLHLETPTLHLSQSMPHGGRNGFK